MSVLPARLRLFAAIACALALMGGAGLAQRFATSAGPSQDGDAATGVVAAAMATAEPASDPGPAPLRALTTEAMDQALAFGPEPVLRQLDLNWLTRLYAFRFTDAALSHEVIVIGPHAEAPRWRARTVTSEFSNLLWGEAVALRLDVLRASPEGVAQAVMGLRPDMALTSIALVPELNNEDEKGMPEWVTFGAMSRGVLRCEIADSAPPLRVSCPYPPMQPPRVATATP